MDRLLDEAGLRKDRRNDHWLGFEIAGQLRKAMLGIHTLVMMRDAVDCDRVRMTQLWSPIDRTLKLQQMEK